MAQKKQFKPNPMDLYAIYSNKNVISNYGNIKKFQNHMKQAERLANQMADESANYSPRTKQSARYAAKLLKDFRNEFWGALTFYE